MKRNLIAVLVLTLVFLASCNKKEEVALDNEKAEVGYAIGIKNAEGMKKQNVDFDPKAFAQAIQDYYNGNAKMDSKKVEEVLKKFQEKKMKEAQEKKKITDAENAKKGAENLKKGEEFLKANATKKDVVTTKSGLQYSILKKGKGAQPKATDKVKVHYEGKLLDGTVFDSSYKRNEPTEFFLNRVIPGWTEGVQLMKIGSKFRFYIPSNLAYGKNSAGAHIGPNSTLVFDVELLEIVK